MIIPVIYGEIRDPTQISLCYMEVKVMRTPKVEQDNSKKRTITSKHFEIVLPIFVCLTYKLKVGKYFNDELKEYANINSY